LGAKLRRSAQGKRKEGNRSELDSDVGSIYMLTSPYWGSRRIAGSSPDGASKPIVVQRKKAAAIYDCASHQPDQVSRHRIACFPFSSSRENRQSTVIH
jgi:hypothetical protein